MSNNLLDTKTVNLTDVIGNGKKYKIPSFQRDYSWEKDQWEDLWIDMKDAYESGLTHYMGAIVLQAREEGIYDVIDGQQRLTTLSIFAIAIVQFLKNLAINGIETEKNNERSDILRRNFIGDKDASSLIYSSKLFLNENNDHFYQSNLVNFKKPIGKLTDSQKLIWECYEYFYEKIKTFFGEDGEKVTIFFEKNISKNLMFIQITVQDELSAYTVFETLNSRGVELTTTDLLKNFLFSKVSESVNDLQFIKKEWTEIVNIVGLKDFPTFLRYYINSKYDLVGQKQLFKFIKNQISEKEKVIELLSELRNNAIIYTSLSNPSDDFWKQFSEYKKIEQHIGELKLFGVKTVKSLLLSGFRKFSIDEFVKLLKLTSVISFRYNIVGGRDPKIMETEYNRVAKKIENGEITKATQVFESLKPKLYIEDDEFKDIFKNLKVKISQRKLIKYILIHIDNKISGSNRDYDSDNGTIEHILPENPNHEWNEAFPENIRESFIERLGNYLLLELNLNKNGENKKFDDKLSIYGDSSFMVTKEMKDKYDEWNSATIDRLQSFYAKKATEIWRVDF